MSNYNNPSYDDRKPSILDEKDYNFAAPKTNNKSLINQENLNNSLSSRINNEELFCDNSCTGSFFAYHKQKKELK